MHSIFGPVKEAEYLMCQIGQRTLATPPPLHPELSSLANASTFSSMISDITSFPVCLACMYAIPVAAIKAAAKAILKIFFFILNRVTIQRTH